jgi:hypothetical protein
MKFCKAEYLEKALQLKEDERERVLSRMTGKLPKRLVKDKLTVDEAIALQLEIEDENLKEWRRNWAEIRQRENTTMARSANDVADEKTAAGKKKAKANKSLLKRVRLESIAPLDLEADIGSSLSVEDQASPVHQM